MHVVGSSHGLSVGARARQCRTSYAREPWLLLSHEETSNTCFDRRVVPRAQHSGGRAWTASSVPSSVLLGSSRSTGVCVIEYVYVRVNVYDMQAYCVKCTDV